MRPSFKTAVLAILSVWAAASGAAGGPLRMKIADLFTAAITPKQNVELCGTIVAAQQKEFMLEDESGDIWIYSKAETTWSAGDTVRLVCTVTEDSLRDNKRLLVNAYQIEIVTKGNPPPILDLTPRAFADGKGDNRTVRLSGVITDTFSDEIDPNFRFFTLESSGETVFIAYHTNLRDSPNASNAFVDREVEVVGICRTDSSGLNRLPFSRTLVIENLSAFRLLDTDVRSPFDADSQLVHSTGTDIGKRRFPHRQWVTGVVLVVWHGDSFYLQTECGGRKRVTLMPDLAPPAPGDTVTAAGFVRFRGSFIQLKKAVFRKEPVAAKTLDVPALTDPRTILYDNDGKVHIQPHHEGELMRISGKVRDVFGKGTADGRILLDANGISLPVLIGNRRPPEVKSSIEVTGACRIDYDTDERTDGFVQFTGISLIARSGDNDIVLVAAPPWWTPARLSILVVCLLALLVGAAVWNRMLHALANRRGAELMAEQIDHVTAELKTDERTRLAVELHDSLSQTLTGVSMGIDSAIDLAQDMPDDLQRQLEYTSKTVEACRTELKNCLWDLRSEALEASDMNDAIKLALGQIVNLTALTVRFNVPRSRLSDKTAHTILRIIRELVTNAIRHGHATEIKIAGSIDGETLRFSVKDNGCGFDFDMAPGIAEGHFGLQGIQERLDLMDGDMTVESSPGKGTKVTIAIRIPAEKTTGETING